MRNVRNKLLLLILRFLIRYAIYIVDKSKDIDYTWTSFDSGDNFKKYLYSIIDKIDEKNLSIDDRNNLLIVFLPTGDWDSISNNGTLANIICWLLKNMTWKDGENHVDFILSIYRPGERVNLFFYRKTESFIPAHDNNVVCTLEKLYCEVIYG